MAIETCIQCHEEYDTLDGFECMLCGWICRRCAEGDGIHFAHYKLKKWLKDRGEPEFVRGGVSEATSEGGGVIRYFRGRWESE